MNSSRHAATVAPFRCSPDGEKFLNGLYLGLVEAVFIIELHSRCILYWTPAAERVFGYPVTEVVQASSERLFTEAKSFERLWEVALPNINESGHWRGEWEYRRRDGSCFLAEVLAALLQSDRDTYITFVVRDLTGEKEAERTIRQLKQQLAHRATERNSDLISGGQELDRQERAMREQLRDKEHMAAIGTAAGILAHEINNPLNGISTTVQLMERSLRKERDLNMDVMQAAVHDLGNEINRLQSLLFDFKTISHPQRLNIQQVDIGVTVEELLGGITGDCADRKIKISVELAADLPVVQGDRDKLKQALLNLFKNGCEAMPHGGTLTIKGYRCGGEVCIEVADTGEGVPEGVKIFDLFTTTKARGTGLGLVIVQQVILAHRGSVTFSSRAGEGATFHVRLPISHDTTVD